MRQHPDKDSLKEYILNSLSPTTLREVEARQHFENMLI
jgi:hypothetical protein